MVIWLRSVKKGNQEHYCFSCSHTANTSHFPEEHSTTSTPSSSLQFEHSVAVTFCFEQMFSRSEIFKPWVWPRFTQTIPCSSAIKMGWVIASRVSLGDWNIKENAGVSTLKYNHYWNKGIIIKLSLSQNVSSCVVYPSECREKGNCLTENKVFKHFIGFCEHSNELLVP